ncbi:MAG: signal peptide peptidase SppA [Desulfobacterales bacterium]|nr:MAG: signal peptide peptidase SppA [Desulfobacterales bacterium]
MRKTMFLLLAVITLVFVGCTAPKIRLFPSQADPLKEFTLEGKADKKVLIIPIRGVISDAPREGLIRTKPSVVQEVVSQLRLAEKDEDVRAVILKIDSPGGSVTASDILFNEILTFKKRTGAKVVVAMMGVAASGGYYISLPADYILAHPTTLTGSVGVIFLRPKVIDLMEKVGVGVEVNKSGVNKDMGAPFRRTTAEENKMLQAMTDRLGIRFIDLVAKYRKLNPTAIAEISTARVYLANEAKELGMVDEVGYLDQAVAMAKKLADLPEDAKVVVYRRTEYPDDNIYNTSTRYGGGDLSVISLELPESLNQFHTGFYYLWPAAAMGD